MVVVNATAHWWRPEDNLQESLVWVPGYPAHNLEVDSKSPYLLSLLSGPVALFCLFVGVGGEEVMHEKNKIQ